MIRDRRRLDESLSDEALERIDRTCLEFEADWKQGKRPSIEQYVSGPPSAERSCLLFELLLLDLDYRRRQGESPEANEYRTRFPQDSQLVDEAFQLSPPAKSGAMRVHCPHCHQTIDVAGDASLSDITCSSCGGRFSLVPEATVSYRPAEAKTIGHFELIEQVGIGAFGTVWKAHDTALDRTVAIKIPRKGRLTAAETEQFLREARAAAQLRHPTIVSVHEVGREGDSVYIVSDYVKGLTLADWLTGQRFTPRQAADFSAKIADALEHAHRAGVVHRDLKPGNIMLDAQGEPHIMDFGLAKRDAGEVTMTLDGQVLGTPAYMSPEQAAGQSHKVDGRSDVYSLGVILYQLLTGELPFRGNQAMLIHQVLHEEPQPPRKLNHHVPRDVETICLRAMAKEPVRRYQSAGELAADLRRFLAGEPIRARPVGRMERLWRWCKRKPLVAGLVGSVAILLVLIAVGSTVAAILLHEETQAALTNLERAEEADQDAMEKLWMAYLAQARAGRWSGRMGQRFESLDALAKAAAIRPSPELRDEAIACMALADLRVATEWKPERPPFYWPCFDPTLERYLTDDGKGNVSLRRVHDHVEVFRSRGPGRPVDYKSFSPEGRFLALRHGGGTRPRIWDVGSGKMVFEVPVGMVHGALAFTADGRRVAVGEGDGSIYVYEIASKRELARLRVGGVPDNVAIHPDGKQFALVAQGGFVQIRDLETGSLGLQLPHPAHVHALAWHADGRRLATGCGDFRAYLWDTGGPDPTQPVATLSGHTGEVTSLFFNRAGDLLATSGWDNATRLWDVSSGRLLLSVPGSIASPFSADDRRLGFTAAGETLGIWEVAAGRECRIFYESSIRYKGPQSVSLSPDGYMLASAGRDDVRLWDLAAGDLAVLLPLPDCFWAAFHPADGSLVTNSQFGLQRWAIRKDRGNGVLHVGPATELRAPGINVDRTTSLSATGRFLAMNVRPGDVAIRDLGDPSKEVLLRGPGKMNPLAVSPDGLWLTTGGWQELGLRVWDIRSAKPVRVLHPEFQSPRACFSPDGRWLVTCTVPGYQLWEVGTWRAARYIARKPEGIPPPAAFSPDGRLLAIASSRDTAQLIDVATANPLATLQSPVPRAVGCLDFSADGSRLAVGGDRTTQVWDLRTIRRQLAEMGLDWDQPPYPDGPRPSPAKITSVQVETTPSPVRPGTSAPREQVVAQLRKMGARFVAPGSKSSWSPDAERIVCGRVPSDSGLSIVDLKTGKLSALVESGKDPAWSPGDGRLIAYARGNNAKAEDVWVVEASGQRARKVADGGFPTWSADGKTLYFHSRKTMKLVAMRMDSDKAQSAELASVPWYYPAVSPDGEKVAYRTTADLVVVAVKSAKVLKWEPIPGGGFLAGWSPDGNRLAFGGYGNDQLGLLIVDLEANATAQVAPPGVTMPAWSPDGSKLSFDLRFRGRSDEVWLIETKSLQRPPARKQ